MIKIDGDLERKKIKKKTVILIKHICQFSTESEVKKCIIRIGITGTALGNKLIKIYIFLISPQKDVVGIH